VTERVRFSPSPTGDLHLGGARTALFNWLVARQKGGCFILRIEDTDADRNAQDMETRIIEDLAWLGLEWDEGPDVGGLHGPYRQSERSGSYEHAMAVLKTSGSVYPCYCDEEALARDRAEDEEAGRPPRYRGRCRDRVSTTDTSPGDPVVWRFAVPADREIVVHDLVHGQVTFDSDDLGDFVVARADGSILYDLASVSDDIAMGVSTVIRGDDHLANTARHILLYEALGQQVPRFAHIPLVTDLEGRPLSKRRGAASVRSLRECGYLPEAVLNHLALLGWHDPAGREMLEPDCLVQSFELERVSRAPSAHDPERLAWLNAKHIRVRTPLELLGSAKSFLPEIPDWLDPIALMKALSTEMHLLSDIPSLAAPVIDRLEPDDEAIAVLGAEAAERTLEEALRLLKESEGFDGRVMLQELKQRLRDLDIELSQGLPALRAGLTGRAHGLPIAELFDLLGRDRALERLPFV